MNLQFAFLPLREAQDKTEWKLIRRNLMFSTERPGILFVRSLESYLGKPLNDLYEILKKEKNPTASKKLFCLCSTHGIVSQERFHVDFHVLLALCQDLHCIQQDIVTKPFPTESSSFPLEKNMHIWFWTVISHSSDQPLIHPPHSYPLFVFTDSLLFWYSFYCHFHHWNCSEGKVPIFSAITRSQAF